MVPEKTNRTELEDKISKEAEVEKLSGLSTLSLIDQYAAHYGKFPREVNEERFDDFIPFFVLWLRQREYRERVIEAKKKFKDADV